MIPLILMAALAAGPDQLPAPDRLPPAPRDVQSDNAYRRALPPTDDAWLRGVYARPLTFYSDREMPRAYQHDSGIHASSYNISARPGEPHGNPNVEFPWGGPAGTHRCRDVTAFKFFHFPEPVVWWEEVLVRELSPHNSDGFRWKFPEGSVFGEVLQLPDHKGERWTFELRTRIKVDGKWRANAFRPFVSRSELDDWVATNYPESKLPPAKPRIERLKNPHARRVAIDRTAAVDELPALPREVVEAALARPFRSVLGAEWVRSGTTPGYAPTTKADFHIVPKDYDGAFLEVSTDACMTCHEGTMVDADLFDKSRDWYGRVRGDDNIFSWHPFNPDDISRNGISKRPRLRDVFQSAGILRRRD